MKNKILLAIIILSCTHKSELKHEYGYIVEKSYEGEATTMSTGFGTSSNGDAVITFSSNHEDEKYWTLFKCEHNVIFAINNQKLFTKLSRGDSVIIDYYDILTKKNRLKDFEFVDANKIK